jgi:hypothetical protein
MIDPLSAQQLLVHVRALARDIGPRPAGHPAEAQAREYIRRTLIDLGFDAGEIEDMPFPAPDTWGYLFAAPVVLTLAANGLGKIAGRVGKLIGGALSLFSAYQLWRAAGSRRQPLAPLAFTYPTRPSGNVVVRIPAQEQPKQRVVLIAHTDTNKARATFSKSVKRWLPMLMSAGMLVPLINGVALITRALNGRKKAQLTQRLTVLSLLSFIPLLWLDERGPHIDGANDNASAVACLLALGEYLKQQPLKNTEVWLAFTGAEEVGGLGVHHLLDVYGEQLRDAWFIDFEMVGTREVVYVIDHSLSYLNLYGPDRATLELAFETSRQYPELRVYGRALTIVDEVGALRGRGYRALCLAGVGPDGWLANWHQRTDTLDNIKSIGLEKAARFALGMMQVLDERE